MRQHVDRVALLNNAQWKGKRQRAQTETGSFTQKKNPFLISGLSNTEKVAQRSCGASSPGDIQSLTGHGPEQPTLTDYAQSRVVGLDDLHRSLPIWLIIWSCEIYIFLKLSDITLLFLCAKMRKNCKVK